MLKFLSNEMIYDIIILAIKDIQCIESQMENKKNNQIVLIFDDSKNAELGENNLNKAIFNSINTYLYSKELNPNEYKRDITFTIDGTENTRTISY